MRVKAATKTKTSRLIRWWSPLKPTRVKRNQRVYFRGTVGSRIQALQKRFSEPAECSDSPALSASAG
jgi:hypothetical protein